MLVADYVQGWATARGLGLPHPNTVTELVSLEGGPGRGGGTKRAAKLLGVGERQVQRYMAQEAGARGATEKRGVVALKARREQIARLIQARTPDGQMLMQGINVDRVQARMGRSAKWEEGRVVRDVHIPGKALKGSRAAIRRDDWDEAARQLEEAWADAYEAPLLWDDVWDESARPRKHIPIVDELDMEIGPVGPARRQRRAS